MIYNYHPNIIYFELSEIFEFNLIFLLKKFVITQAYWRVLNNTLWIHNIYTSAKIMIKTYAPSIFLKGKC